MGVPGLLPYVEKKFRRQVHRPKGEKKRCEEKGCKNPPVFGLEGLPPKFCIDHKKEGMIIIKWCENPSTPEELDEISTGEKTYIIEFLDHQKINFTTDYLHLDGNAMIHPAAARVYNYGENAKIGIDPYAGLTQDQKRTETFKVFWREVVDLVERYRPSVLDIALDGPAPIAKQNQQRDRRFTRMEGAEVDDPKKFNSNQISPGTVFMLEWIKFINYRIRKYLETAWKGMKIVFSSGSVPGEGEHKLIDYIRSLPKAEKNKTHTIVGNDGDLIFLTMAAQIPRMFLLRDSGKGVGCKLLLAISRMSKGPLTYHFGVDRKDYQQAINDFTFTGLFVGNDFLPMIPMFVTLENGLDTMIEIIRENSFQLTDGERINFDDFRSFLGVLVAREPEYLADQIPQFENWRGPHPNEGVDKEVFRLKTLEPFVKGKSIDFKGFRKAYHKKIGTTTPEQVMQQCHDYLKTLIWVYIYYTQGLPSWEWYYPHHHAPLMHDLLDYVDTITGKKGGVDKSGVYDFDLGEPSLPFVQLLCILPSSGSSALPPPYRHLMTSNLSPLVEKGYYPLPPYIKDYEWKRKAHQAAVLMSMIDDLGLVRKCYASVARRDPNEYARNQVGRNRIYFYDAKMTPYSYESSYGKIRECYVKFETLI